MQSHQPGSPKLPKGVLHCLALACALTVCGVAYNAVYRPLEDWRRDITARAELAKDKLALAPRIRREHAEKSSELRDLLASVEAIGQRVPDRSREGEFLGDLSRIADQHGVRIKDFHRDKVQETATHSAVSIVVSGEASYVGLCRLLDSVANLPRLASLSKLEVTPVGSAGNYDIQLNYLLYYATSPTPPPS